MARYIDADKLIAEYDRVHVGPAGGARKLMVEAPTADVVPRELYDEEKLRRESLEGYIRERLERACHAAEEAGKRSHKGALRRLNLFTPIIRCTCGGIPKYESEHTVGMCGANEEWVVLVCKECGRKAYGYSENDAKNTWNDRIKKDKEERDE